MKEHEIAKIHVSVNSSATHIGADTYGGTELFGAPKRETCVIRENFNLSLQHREKRRSFKKPRSIYEI